MRDRAARLGDEAATAPVSALAPTPLARRRRGDRRGARSIRRESNGPARRPPLPARLGSPATPAAAAAPAAATEPAAASGAASAAAPAAAAAAALVVRAVAVGVAIDVPVVV